ncbi:MAG: hypothetical protein GYA55_14180 [SAR324 cluster bacterium]|uniref:Uncharacterized protein n=1 Tax=SAR324 cluster bacterium TaxID=2024889 RepID=A0A7X9FUW4_9DELT|nr:hypothetical protein [SAR324 cluster bacterium]
MDSMTFRSRLVQLMQRSRKALRLYSNVERFPNEVTSELSEVQVAEWRRVNSELLRELNLALEHPSQKRVVGEVFGIRDQFYGEWKLAEADMHRKQRQLVECSENADFIKASLLSKELVTLKARAQACQAAHHEINQLLLKSHVAAPSTEKEPQMEELPEPTLKQPEHKAEIRIAKVIPLRNLAGQRS